ncbi:MAG: FixH family protein [Gammaproteobacteria bacterium]|nr:FixH family protein [Gammaproteobacteria bacterium]MDH5728629.1 FixH family protein [Gammaproteobacteria bacterium]
MKKLILSLVSCLFFIAAPSHAFEFIEDLGEMKVKFTGSGNTLQIGKQDVAIEILDSQGRAITDANVKVYYRMPPMGGMPPMNYKTNATITDNNYKANLNVKMGGQWNIKLKIKLKGEKSKNMKLVLNAS